MDNNIEDIDQDKLDAEFLVELNKLVETFTSPSAEDIAIYNNKLTYLEEIHAEVKKKHPEFQPEYDPLQDFDDYDIPKNKYLDTVYNVSIESDNDNTE